MSVQTGMCILPISSSESGGSESGGSDSGGSSGNEEPSCCATDSCRLPASAWATCTRNQRECGSKCTSAYAKCCISGKVADCEAAIKALGPGGGYSLCAEGITKTEKERWYTQLGCTDAQKAQADQAIAESVSAYDDDDSAERPAVSTAALAAGAAAGAFCALGHHM